jgi:hypothetical protein
MLRRTPRALTGAPRALTGTPRALKYALAAAAGGLALLLAGCPQPVSNQDLNVAEDSIPPSISISSPQDDSVYYSTVTLNGIVTDSSAAPGDGKGLLDTLELQVQGAPDLNSTVSFGESTASVSNEETSFAYEESSGGFQWSLPTQSLTREHDFILVATDRNGNVAETAVTLRDSDGPYINIQEPGGAVTTYQEREDVPIEGTLGNSIDDPDSWGEVVSLQWEVVGRLWTGQLDLTEDSDDWDPGTGQYVTLNQNIIPQEQFTFDPETGAFDTEFRVPSGTSGGFEVRLTAEDKNGRVNTESVNLFSDESGPQIVINEPENITGQNFYPAADTFGQYAGLNPTVTVSGRALDTSEIENADDFVYVVTEDQGETEIVAETNIPLNGDGTFSITPDLSAASDDGDTDPITITLTAVDPDDNETIIDIFYDADTSAPTASVELDDGDGVYSDGQSVTYTVTFSEAVTDLSGSDPASIEVSGINAASAELTSAGGSDTEFTATTTAGPGNGAADVRVTNVRDLNGNPIDLTSQTFSYTVDNDAPTPIIDSTALPGPTGASEIPITVDFGETMTGFTAGDVSLTASGSINDFSNDGGGSYSFDIGGFPSSVTETVEVDISPGVALDLGSNGNEAAATFSISYDNADPQVDSIAPTPGLILDSTTGTGTFTLDINFTESMDQSVDPTVSFPAEDPTATISQDAGASGWTDADTYRAVFDVTDAEENVSDVDVEIAGAEDTAGNTITAQTVNDLFTVDNDTPDLVNLSATRNPINEADAGQQVDITAEFDQAMDTGTTPTIAFNGGGSPSALDAALTDPEGWDSTTTYRWTYDITDDDTDTDDINITIGGGAADPNGNTHSPETQNNFLTVDMVPPDLSSAGAAPATLAQADVGGDALTITLTFTDAMDTSGTPSISFSGAAGGSLTLTSDDWGGDPTTYEATYDFTDQDVEIPNIDVTVTNITDGGGNGISAVNSNADVFSIDTVAPTVQTTTLEGTAIDGGDNLINVSDEGEQLAVKIEYSETMDTGDTPAVTFTPDITMSGSDVLQLNGGASGWSATDVTNDTYTAVYDVQASTNVEITGGDTVDVSVAGGSDAAGNVASVASNPDVLAVDTDEPQVDSVTAAPDPIAEADAGSTFTVTVQYDQPMDSGFTPTLSFLDPAEDPTNTLTASGGGGWTGGDTYEFDYSVADNNEELSNIDVRVAGGADPNGNTLPSDYDKPDLFSIDTIAPTIDTLDRDDASPTNATSVDFSVDFSEPVNDFDTGDIAVNSGITTNSPSLSGSDAQYTATVDGISGDGTVGITVSSGGIVDDAGNAFSGPESSPDYSVDTVAPSVSSISVAGAAEDGGIIDLSDVGEAFDVVVVYTETMYTGANPTITFSPDVATSGSGVLQLDTGASGWSMTNTTNDTFTATYTVQNNGDEQSNVDIDVSGGQDAVGNGAFGDGINNVFDVDTIPPTVTINSPADNDRVTGTTAINFNVSDGSTEARINSGSYEAFTSGDTFSDLTDFSGLPEEASFDVTIRATDTAGNPGTATLSGVVKDTIAPTVSQIRSLDTDTDGDIDTIEIEFSEPIRDSTYSKSDFTIDGAGGSGAINSFNTVVSAITNDADSDDEYIRLSLAAIAGTGPITYGHDGNSIEDTAGNQLAAISAGSDVSDHAEPILTGAKDTGDNNGHVLNEAGETIKLTFSETVSFDGTDADDLEDDLYFGGSDAADNLPSNASVSAAGSDITIGYNGTASSNLILVGDSTDTSIDNGTAQADLDISDSAGNKVLAAGFPYPLSLPKTPEAGGITGSDRLHTHGRAELRHRLLRGAPEVERSQRGTQEAARPAQPPEGTSDGVGFERVSAPPTQAEEQAGAGDAATVTSDGRDAEGAVSSRQRTRAGAASAGEAGPEQASRPHRVNPDQPQEGAFASKLLLQHEARQRLARHAAEGTATLTGGFGAEEAVGTVAQARSGFGSSPDDTRGEEIPLVGTAAAGGPAGSTMVIALLGIFSIVAAGVVIGRLMISEHKQ